LWSIQKIKRSVSKLLTNPMQSFSDECDEAVAISPAKVRVSLWVRNVFVFAHSRLEMSQFIRQQCVCSGRCVKRLHVVDAMRARNLLDISYQAMMQKVKMVEDASCGI
jgi:hypothetical protein